MAVVTIYSDFGAPPKKSFTVSIISPSIFHEVIWPGAIHDITFLNVEF